jgi:hypothetical protein
MFKKGYVSKGQRDLERNLYEALKALIESDIARGNDRVDWARRMMDKGYLSKERYEAELFKHYKALKARMMDDSMIPEVVKSYEALKARYENKSRRPELHAPDEDSQTQPKAKSASPGAGREEQRKN